MSERHARSEHGYTLVELLVVLVLVSLIATAMSAGFQFGTRVWERSQSGISNAETHEASQTVLRELLASAIPRMDGGLARFDGEPDRLSFDATPPAAFGASGLARVELSLARGEDGTALKVKIASLVDPRTSREGVLVPNLGHARFAYLDASERLPAWLGYWRHRPHMPDAVSLEASDGPLPWPYFVARLGIAQDARCQFDPVSTDCRKR